MKKIIASLLAVVVVVGAVAVSTQAYFTDTETSEDNTFTTGSIDIDVNEQNPWRQTFKMEDMKPSQTDYIDFIVHNKNQPDSNPVNLYKELTNFVTSDFRTSEPECQAEGGSWSNGVCSTNVAVTNIDDWMNYDLKVELYDVDPKTNPTAEPVWWENIYTDGVLVGGVDHVKKVGDLESSTQAPVRMYLGMIPAGKWMKVMQSYHLVSETANQYQADRLTFDIVLTAEQLGASALRLENKVEVGGISYTQWWDTTYADLTYKVKDREFGYTLNVSDFVDGNYDLVAWEGYPSFAWGSGPTVTVLANVTVAGGDATKTASVELGQDLINAKVWLVPSTGVTPSLTRTLPWPLGNALFETGLMDYYDADL